MHTALQVTVCRCHCNIFHDDKKSRDISDALLGSSCYKNASVTFSQVLIEEGDF
jgi:hypothetical protein